MNCPVCQKTLPEANYNNPVCVFCGSLLDLRKTHVTPDTPPLSKTSFSAVGVDISTPPSDKIAFESVDGAAGGNEVLRKPSILDLSKTQPRGNVAPIANKSSKNTKKTLFVALLSLVFVILLFIIGFVAYCDNNSLVNLKEANAKMAAGDFSGSSVSINKAKQPFVLATTGSKVLAAEKKLQKWQNFQKIVAQANELYNSGNYNEATKLLAGVESGYPRYAEVATLAVKIENQNNLINPILIGPFTSEKATRFVSTAAASQLEEAKNVTQAQDALQKFASQYSLKFQVTDIMPSQYASSHNKYQLVSEQDLPQLKALGLMFIDEWAKYPKEFVKATSLKNIIFVNKLNVDNTYRAAMPDSMGDALYYDVSFAYNQAYMRAVIHHEYNHVFTYNIVGNDGSTDRNLQALNTPGFTYGNGGASCYLAGNSCVSGEHPKEGFVTGYAMSGADEDKAEIFAYLMTTKNYKQLTNWVESDKTLATKVDFYKHFLKDVSNKMSDSYFDDINK